MVTMSTNNAANEHTECLYFTYTRFLYKFNIFMMLCWHTIHLHDHSAMNAQDNPYSILSARQLISGVCCSMVTMRRASVYDLSNWFLRYLSGSCFVGIVLALKCLIKFHRVEWDLVWQNTIIFTTTEFIWIVRINNEHPVILCIILNIIIYSWIKFLITIFYQLLIDIPVSINLNICFQFIVIKWSLFDSHTFY